MSETLSITISLNDYDSLNHDKETYGKSRKILSTMNGLINQIILNYTCDCKEKIKNNNIRLSSHNSKVFKFRPSNETKEYILSNSDSFDLEKNSIPTYIRYILNCFTKLQNSNKVKILYKDIIDKIELAIAAKKKISYINSNNESRIISPLYIHEDKNINALYLIGLNGKGDSTSYRIFRISKIKVEKENIDYSNNDKIVIDARLVHEGPVFLDEKPEKIILKLTENGKYRYTNEKLFRPMYSKANDDIFEFYCTHKQIKYYFFKLGKEVTVISPDDLRNEFVSMYEKALQTYIQ